MKLENKSSNKKIILLKLTGEALSLAPNEVNIDIIKNLAQQIIKLSKTVKFGLVIGGGNIFRGLRDANKIKISQNVSDYIGIFATIVNGLIIQDIFKNFGLNTILFSSINCPEVAFDISPQNINLAKQNTDCLIFSGGLGNPYFTTDTNSVVRALQIEAKELWKATKVDGIYTKDPNLHKDAKLFKKISYDYAIENSLNIMDASAFVLAKQNKLKLRIFNLFEKDSLIKAAENKSFGSIVE